MRRKDKEITEQSDMLDILTRADIVYLALDDGGAPYVLPMNFGFSREEDALYLYFHCARVGKKLDLIRANPKAAFTACVAPQWVRGEGVICNSSMAYESVCGTGEIEILPDDMSEHALSCVISHYTHEKAVYGPNQLRATLPLRLRVDELTGKRSTPKIPSASPRA
ncbi:MAG: pyridoxamine 5'-phosphate oxidase family protein [Clostridia bacterium]